MAITGIFNILLENWIVIAVGFVAIFLLFKLLKKEKKPEFKEIDRAEIERKNYIERHKKNKPKIKMYFYISRRLEGKINSISHSSIEKNKCIEMVVKPNWDFKLVRISNPLRKEYIIVALEKDLERMKDGYNVINFTYFDKFMGIFYPKEIQKECVNWIVTDSIFKTDWNSFASVYFAKAQEQATFNPVYANEVMLENIKLQQEKIKRERVVSNN